MDNLLKVSTEFNLAQLENEREKIIKETLTKIYRKFNFHDPRNYIDESLQPFLNPLPSVENRIIDGFI